MSRPKSPQWRNWQILNIVPLIATLLLLPAIRSLEYQERPDGFWGVIAARQAIRVTPWLKDPYVAYIEACAQARQLMDKGKVFATFPPSLLADEHVRYQTDKVIDSAASMSRELPSEESVWNNLAWLHLATGDMRASYLSARKAMSLAKNDYMNNIVLALLAESRGDVADAKKEYGDALIKYPRLGSSQFWHDLVRRQPGIATAAFDMAISKERIAYVSLGEPLEGETLARLLQENGYQHEAAVATASVLDRLPNLAGAWELRGEQEELTNVPDAVASFKKAEFLQPRDPYIRAKLAEVYFYEGDSESAYRESRQAFLLQERVATASSQRANLQYRRDWRDGNPPKDYMISGMLSYTGPRFDYVAFFSRLSESFTERGNDEIGEECRRLYEKALNQSENMMRLNERLQISQR